MNELTDEEKREIFNRIKIDNFEASTRLEGLEPAELPEDVTLEQLKLKWTQVNK